MRKKREIAQNLEKRTLNVSQCLVGGQLPLSDFVIAPYLEENIEGSETKGFQADDGLWRELC